MRELSGLSIEEIAAALSVSPGAAKQTLFEARSSLHELAEGRAMECVRRSAGRSPTEMAVCCAVAGSPPPPRVRGLP
jgi:hypothetical protein